METIKDILNFCNSAVLYDYKNIGIIEELKQVRKCIINSFYKTIPDTRIRVSLSIFDDINMKINNNNIENNIENIHDLEKIYCKCSHLRNCLETNNRLIDQFWTKMAVDLIVFVIVWMVVTVKEKFEKTRQI